jgi:hypothetical protein
MRRPGRHRLNYPPYPRESWFTPTVLAALFTGILIGMAITVAIMRLQAGIWVWDIH